MPEPIRIDFQVGGIARVREALDTIAAATLRTERASVRSAQNTTRTREREYASLARTATRWERESVKATEKAERDKTRTVEREAKNKVASMIKADRMQLQAQRDAAREFERIEADKNRRAMTWVKKREREELESARRVLRARESFARTVTGAAGRGLSVGMRAATSATMAVAGSMLSLGGGFSISDSVHRSTAATGLAADIANSGFLPQGTVEANRTKRTTGEITGAARGAATQYGLDTMTSLGGLQKFVGISGNLDAGMKLLPKLAEISRATGTSLDDLAEAAGNVSLNLGETDTNGEQTLYVIRKLAEGGKLGAVEMRDFAAQMAKVSSAASKFAGNRAENMIKMGALAQEARGEGGAFSASVAANAVSGFTTTLTTSARVNEFLGHGINPYADKGNTKFKAPEEIIIESLRATKGNKLEMNKLFKNVMGDRAISGFATRYTDAGGGAAGEAAVRGRFAELIGKSSPKELESQFRKDASDRMQEADAKMAQTMARFDAAVAEKIVPKMLELMPAIEKLIPEFVDLAARGVPAFVNLIKSVAEFADANKSIIQSIAAHPLGAIIALEVTKSVGGAAIGVAIRDTLANVITKGAGGNPMTFTGAVTMAAGAVTIMAAKQAVDETLSGQVAGQRRVGEIQSEISHLNELPSAKRGTAVARIQAELSRAQATGGLKVGNYDPAALVIDTVATAITGDKKGIFGANEAVQKGAYSEELIKNMDRFNAGLEKANESFSKMSSPDITNPNAPSRKKPLSSPERN